MSLRIWITGICAGTLGLMSLAAQAQTVRYIHTDALGSVVAVTVNGQVMERREYEPYGAQLTPAVGNGPGYTGHVQDTATGLVYMQQRYYDPSLGRMLSVDPVRANPNTGESFNRYAYAANNPNRFTDPDGRAPEANDTDICASGGGNGCSYSYYSGIEQGRGSAERRKIAALAVDAATTALGDTVGKPFSSAAGAAIEWASRVVPVANRFLTEIASMLYRVDGGVAYGLPTSDGYVLEVDPILAVPLTFYHHTVGYIHTHPNNSTFGERDLVTAIKMYESANGSRNPGGIQQSAFVGTAGGEVHQWSTQSYFNNPASKTWDPYMKDIDRGIK